MTGGILVPKCCSSCYLYEDCEKRNECCEECDFYNRGRCMLSEEDAYSVVKD